MRRIIVLMTGGLTFIVLAACATRNEPSRPAQPSITLTPTPSPSASPEETPSPSPSPSPQSSNPPTSAVPQGELPYAKPVPGKPGYVYSPYAPTMGYVDVKGYAPGTEVKCPYTGKIFLVP